MQVTFGPQRYVIQSAKCFRNQGISLKKIRFLICLINGDLVQLGWHLFRLRWRYVPSIATAPTWPTSPTYLIRLSPDDT